MPNQILNRTDSSKCTLTLKQIQKELKFLTDQAHQGIDIDEARFDYLLRAQEHNEEYKQLIAEEKASWRESVYEFAEQCLERTRTFVPVNIFESSLDNLLELGLSTELAKRILQRQCLWLSRMSKAEIASLHESDLVGRFNSSAQNMDIIETAAIYFALPEQFNGDEAGRKAEWRDSIEENLRRMLQDNDNGQLPDGRIRHPSYEGRQFGPIDDVTSVRETNIVSGKNSHKPRRSFLEVCKKHSILSSANLKADPVLDSSDSEAGGFEDEYEDDAEVQAGEEEEVYVVDDGSSAQLNAAIHFQPATSYQTRDFIDTSYDEDEEDGEQGLDNGEDDGADGDVEEEEEGREDHDDFHDCQDGLHKEQPDEEARSESGREGSGSEDRVYYESLAEEQAQDRAEYDMLDSNTHTAVDDESQSHTDVAEPNAADASVPAIGEEFEGDGVVHGEGEEEEEVDQIADDC